MQQTFGASLLSRSLGCRPGTAELALVNTFLRITERGLLSRGVRTNLNKLQVRQAHTPGRRFNLYGKHGERKEHILKLLLTRQLGGGGFKKSPFH